MAQKRMTSFLTFIATFVSISKQPTQVTVADNKQQFRILTTGDKIKSFRTTVLIRKACTGGATEHANVSYEKIAS
jgi:hypothetical protein